MPDKDKLALQAILESINLIETYTRDTPSLEHFISAPIVSDACLMHLVNIGEMVSRLSDDFIDKHSQIEWYKIKGLRNIIAHDYFGIDLGEVWSVIKKHLPLLKAYICTV